MTRVPLIAERRYRGEMQVKDYLQGAKRRLDPDSGLQIVKIFSGDCYVTGQPDEMLVTILGSCVSACIRDPIARVGGMNHFLLPGTGNKEVESGAAARYGLFAMESLINGILSHGGRKDRLEIKVFGGGNVINNSARIGTKNAEFIRGFLKSEGYRIASEDLEGTHPRRLHYFPDSGKVMMRRLQRKEDMVIVEEEARYSRSIASKPIEGDIDLF